MCAKKSTLADSSFNEYYSDMTDKVMNNALLLRSPVVSKGSFTFKTDELPDGYAIFTADNIPGKNEFVVNGLSVPVFAKDSVLYKGQPVGIVTGPDVQVLKRICNSLVVTADNEISGEEINTSEDSETILEYETKTQDFEESLFPASAHVISAKWISNLEDISISETEGVFISYSDGHLKVFSHSSEESAIIKAVSSIAGTDKGDIEVVQTKSTKKSQFYGWQTILLCAQVAVAVANLKTSVKLVFSRQEHINFVVRPMDVQVNHTTALDENGRITAWNIDISVDAGNLVPGADQLIHRFETVAMGLYDCDEYKIHVKVLKTDNSPVSINFSSVDSYCNYAVECHLHKIAEDLDLDPVELRIINAYDKNDSKPFKSDKSILVHLLESIKNKCDFTRKNCAYRISEKSRYAQNNISPFVPPVRGIGLSCGANCGTSENSNNFASPSVGACIVEMDFEPATYDITLRGVWLCINAGQISRQDVAEIKNKISICVRNVLFDLVDDHIVQSDHIELLLANSTEKSRIYDNIASNLVPAAFMNALSQTLAHIVNKAPVSKEVIYKILTQAQKSFEEKMAILRLSEKQNKESEIEINNDNQEENGEQIQNGFQENTEE